MSYSLPFPEHKLHQVLIWSLNNMHCDFYRAHWKQYGFTHIPVVTELASVWKTIPPITREILSERPHPSDRLFIDMNEVKQLRATSGTSGRTPFLFFTHNFSCTVFYQTLYKKGGTRGMYFCNAENFALGALEARNAGISMLHGDPHNLPRAAYIAQAAQVNTLRLSPTLALVFAPYLAKANYAHNINFICLYGEACTATMYRQLRDQFPNAQFMFQYAQSEVLSTVGMSDSRCTNPYNTFHILTNKIYIEIDNGEIVLTTLTVPHAEPLIRYYTGDAGKLVERTCPCGNPAPRLRVQGRIQGDSVRAGGGELKAAELERVLTPFASRIEPVFQLIVTESGNSTPPTLHLSVIPRTTEQTAVDLLTIEIKETLLKEFRLSSTMRLGDAVAAGLLAPPIVAPTIQASLGHKNPRIIFKSHA